MLFASTRLAFDLQDRPPATHLAVLTLRSAALPEPQMATMPHAAAPHLLAASTDFFLQPFRQHSLCAYTGSPPVSPTWLSAVGHPHHVGPPRLMEAERLTEAESLERRLSA